MKYLKQITVVSLIVSLLAAGMCFRVSALVIYEGDFGFEVNYSKHTAALVKYTGGGNTVRLPDYFQDYPVTTIDRNAFFENKTIKEIVFSNTNTTVEEYAFFGCTSLETVAIPENVVNFGDRVFAECTALKTVSLMSNMTSVPSNMFSGCTSLENLTINENIAEFGYGCFNDCSSLVDLDFVTNGVLVQSYAFNGTGADSVELSDSLFAIPNNAFTNCPDLKYVTIPRSVAFIQPYAFDFENITIRCYYDSYAYTYAKEKNIPYELIDNVLLGDVNGDDAISIGDATVVQRHIADLESPEGIYLYAADINQDGNVDISDAAAIQMFLAKYDLPYTIGDILTQ